MNPESKLRQKLREILGKEITHFWVDEDNWFSCPKAPDGCTDETRGTECTCGRDESINKTLESILEAVRAEVPEKRECPKEGSFGMVMGIDMGWNEYATELLKRLE